MWGLGPWASDFGRFWGHVAGLHCFRGYGSGLQGLFGLYRIDKVEGVVTFLSRFAVHRAFEAAESTSAHGPRTFLLRVVRDVREGLGSRVHGSDNSV